MLAANLEASGKVAKIFQAKNWGFMTSLPEFKAWIADIIEGNNLQETGIIFIWDEFTSYLRNNPTDDVLQPLSEFCKEQPFFMFLIVHRAPSWVSQIGEEVYEQIVHRYHSLDFHVSESAAYELIGSSIRTRPGMEEQWKAQQDTLMKSISTNFADFDNLDMSNKKDRLRQLCPLHPMTLSLLAIVAQNFGASQRTLFRFMKDTKESEQNVGFIYYINNFGPDDWYWLTPDFLWDYFFTRESDVRSFSSEAKSAYQHYMTKREYISDDYHMHVFKAAMLLIAVMSSGNVSNLYSQATQRKVSATRSTLYKCFAGLLNKTDLDGYLDDLEQIGVLRLDGMSNGDKRLSIPYSGNADVFDVRKGILVGKYTRYELFKKNGFFSKSIEAKVWDKTSASYGRMYIAACDSSTNSINLRFNEVQAELRKCAYKFGILVIAISEQSDFAAMQDKVKSLAATDTTGRMAIYLLFIQHAMYSLKDSGKAAIVVPTGFLTAKSGIEMAIRTKMVDEKMLMGVVSMPSNIFANTGTNVSVIFIDKANKHDDAILIDASKLGEKVKDGKNQRTVLRPDEVSRIIDTFINREEIDDFSVLVPFDGLKEKNYSFSAGQYFEVRIEYVDITAEEFKQRMDTYMSLLSRQFQKGKELEDSIMKQMGGLKYDE